MPTILKACRVPWAISPSASGMTLNHTETDVAPRCVVTLGAYRAGEPGHRQVELEFDDCHRARVGPIDGAGGVKAALGYSVEGGYEGDINRYLEWRERQWRRNGLCPDSGFFVALQSQWLGEHTESWEAGFHYVLRGRDGYAEVIATRFRWAERIWGLSEGGDAPALGPVVASGEGVE